MQGDGVIGKYAIGEAADRTDHQHFLLSSLLDGVPDGAIPQARYSLGWRDSFGSS